MRLTLTSLRQSLAQSVPPWLNTPIDSHTWTTLTAAPSPPPTPVQKSPHWRRRLKVYEVLDRVQSQAHPLPSYTQLIHQVQQETGTACSRKLISRWKLERGLRS